MRNYDDQNYAANRLIGTYVRTVTGRAVEVRAIGGGTAVVKELLSNNEKIIPYNDLDITPVPLGYANLGGRSIYVVRSPMRNDWKQGARPKNLRWIENINDEDEGRMIAQLRDQLPTKTMGEIIEGIYPEFNGVIKALSDGRAKVFSMAWDRNFSLTRDWDIFHKGKYKIGKLINRLTKEYQLNDNSWWAKEALDESLNGKVA